MKKLFVCLITLAMIFSLSTSVMAGTVSLQVGIEGKAFIDSKQSDTTNAYLLEFKAPVNHWLVALDYSTLTVKDGLNSQVWNYNLKGGYSFVDNPSARISATLGHYHQNIRNDILVSAVTIGLDSELKLAKNLNLEFAVDTALTGKDYRHYGSTSPLNSALHYKVNLNCYLNPSLAITLGYYYNEYRPEGTEQTSHNAMTLGLTSRF